MLCCLCVQVTKSLNGSFWIDVTGITDDQLRHRLCVKASRLRLHHHSLSAFACPPRLGKCRNFWPRTFLRLLVLMSALFPGLSAFRFHRVNQGDGTCCQSGSIESLLPFSPGVQRRPYCPMPQRLSRKDKLNSEMSA